MKSKNKFKIGEFSKLNRVTVKTLRHYEKIGLLKPHEVDQWSGYRYYDASQFQKMSTILYLKQLRFTLEEIRSMFEEGLQVPEAEVVLEKIKECRKEQSLIDWQLGELTNLGKRLQVEITMENIIIKSLPAITVASYRKVIKDYSELNYLCPFVIGAEMRKCGCTCNNLAYCYTFEHDKVHKETDIDVEYCEAVDAPFQSTETLKCKEIAEVKSAVCLSHKGSYNNFQHSMAIIINYIEENGYKIIDYPRFSYIDGAWNKESEAEYLTEIQVPVEKN